MALHSLNLSSTINISVVQGSHITQTYFKIDLTSERRNNFKKKENFKSMAIFFTFPNICTSLQVLYSIWELQIIIK